MVNAFDPWARDRGEYYSLDWKPRADAKSDPAFRRNESSLDPRAREKGISMASDFDAGYSQSGKPTRIAEGLYCLSQKKGGRVHAFLLDDGDGLTPDRCALRQRRRRV